jgi:hypothetical protein
MAEPVELDGLTVYTIKTNRSECVPGFALSPPLKPEPVLLLVDVNPEEAAIASLEVSIQALSGAWHKHPVDWPIVAEFPTRPLPWKSIKDLRPFGPASLAVRWSLASPVAFGVRAAQLNLDLNVKRVRA